MPAFPLPAEEKYKKKKKRGCLITTLIDDISLIFLVFYTADS